MQSAWSEDEATTTVAELTQRYPDRCDRHVALRVYTSRLIGREPGLVLHGGGNTSVKTTLRDDLGETCEVLCVKGSGWDLGGIDVPGLPAVRLRPLQALRELESLDDAAMVNAARTRLLDASAPNPSVEVLLHAFLPHRYIDHSHADAILSLVSQADAPKLLPELFGDRLAIVPYVMPGFALAKLAAEIAEAHPDCEGLLLLQHGLFTFGASARESYERHIAAVTAAEVRIAAAASTSRATASAGANAAIDDEPAPTEPATAAPAPTEPSPAAPAPAERWSQIAPILRGVLSEGERCYVLQLRRSPELQEFIDRPSAELRERSGRGPATPDHVIRTKQRPLVLEVAPQLKGAALTEAIASSVAAFRRDYAAYFERQTEGRGLERIALDPDPRVVLIPGVGLVGVGVDDRAARIAADLYEHTITVIRGAEAIGHYKALPEADIFDMEYWPLEQAKLGKRARAPLAGRIVIITGAAGGIGLACAQRFAESGAALMLVDRDEQGLCAAAKLLPKSTSVTTMVADNGDRSALEACVEACVARFGGVDGVIANAGIAPQAPIAACPPELFEESLRINLLGHHWLAAAATQVMLAQGRGGFLLFNASKAAFNPGAGFGPYAIAKAALVALMKQYALEHGADGIRSNAVNADRIRTGLLPPEVVRARAAARGLGPDDYFRANLLRREVLASEVADAFLHLALATGTTGAVLTVDGGNIAASPR